MSSRRNLHGIFLHVLIRISLSLAIVGAAAPIAATTYYVNVAAGTHSNTGTSPASDAAFKSVTKAMSVAIADDTIYVAAGTYSEGPIVVKSGVRLIGTGGVGATILNPRPRDSRSGPVGRVIECLGNAPTTLIQGVTISRRDAPWEPNGDARGGGIFCDAADHTTITGNIIDGNPAGGTNGGTGLGGRIYTAGTTTIVNNVIHNNDASFGSVRGGGIYASGAAATIVNNTVDHNSAIGNSAGGGVFANGSAVLNDIITNNAAQTQANPVMQPTVDGGVSDSAAVFNCLFFNNTGGDGTTGVSPVIGLNPLFLSVEASIWSPDDFHLRPKSAARQAGTSAGAPAVDIEGIVRGNPPAVGAYETGALPNRADFNGDGYDDLLWQHSDGQVVVWFMQGTSVIGNATIASDVAPGWRVGGTGDFDRDGNVDIVWYNSLTSDVAIWTMTGTTRKGAVFLGLIWGPPPGWFDFVGVCDFNSDLSPDLLIQGRGCDRCQPWVETMNGTAVTQHGHNIETRLLTLVCDFDADGLADWTWRGTAGEVYTELDRRPGYRFETLLATVPDQDWRIVAAADLNRDGFPDLVWRHATTGANVVWFITPASYGGDPYAVTIGSATLGIATVADPGWQIVGPR